MKFNFNSSLPVALGALWGLSEATLGWGMHLLHLPYKSLLLFPIGLFFMLYGVQATGRALTAIRIALVAALVKLSNLLMPGAFPAYYVINPAMAICLEGLAVYAFSYFAFGHRPEKKGGLLPLWVPAVGWILLSQLAFTGWQSILSYYAEPNPVFGRPASAACLFPFLLQILLKAGMLAFMARRISMPQKKFVLQPFNRIGAASLLILACIVNYITL